MSIFTQSKDYDEISDDNGATAFWQWRNQSVPDADELDDGFAVKYVDGTTGDQHLYFGADRFAVNIIPHSWSHTNLPARAVGDGVNIEVDMLARYVARQLAFRAQG